MRCIVHLFAVACCAVAVFSGVPTDADERALKPGDSFKECDDCPEMVVVPAGEFIMGAPPEEEVATEREDQLRVSIARPFAVGRFAVTRGEFAAFVGRTDHKADRPCYDLTKWNVGEADRNGRSPGFPRDERHPVVCDSTAQVLDDLQLRGHRLHDDERFGNRETSFEPFLSRFPPDQDTSRRGESAIRSSACCVAASLTVATTATSIPKEKQS